MRIPAAAEKFGSAAATMDMEFCDDHSVSASLDAMMRQKAIDRFLFRCASPLAMTVGGEAVSREKAGDEYHAGMPIFVWCEFCGWLSDLLDEEYFLSEPRRVCSECRAVVRSGWMAEARRLLTERGTHEYGHRKLG